MTQPHTPVAQPGQPSLRLTRTDLLIAAGLLLAAFLPLTRALLVPGTTAYGYDISLYFAFEAALRDGIANGAVPLWTPYFSGGMPLLGAGQAPVAYLPGWLFRLLSLDNAVDGAGFVHVWLSGLGIFVLLRAFGLKVAAAFGALAWMMSGALIARFNAGHITFHYAVAWSGWIAVIFRRLLLRGGWLTWIGLVLMLALIGVTGHPQYIALVLAIPALVILHTMLEMLREKRARSVVKGLLLSTGAAATAMALAAVHLLPSAQLFAQSTRSAGLTYEQAIAFGMAIPQLVHLLSPLLLVDLAEAANAGIRLELVHETSPFVGVVTLWLAAAACFRPPGEGRRLARLMAAAAILSLLLALGGSTPVYGVFYRLLPFLRAPGRFLIVWAFSVTVMAALGLDYLIARKTPGAHPRSRFWGLVIIGLAVLIAAGLLLTGALSTLRLSGWALIVTLLAVGLLLVAYNSRVGRLHWGWLAVAVLLAETQLFAWSVVPPEPSPAISGEKLESLDIDPSAVRLGTGGRAAAVALVPTFVGDAPPGVRTLAAVLDLGMEPGERGSQLMAAGFVVTDAPLDDPTYRLVQQAEGAYLYEHEDNWPRIIAAPAVAVVPTDKAALARVAAPGFDPWAAAIITMPEGVGPRLPDTATRVLEWQAEYTCYEADRICATVEVSAPAVVVFSEMNYPGWEATVDGVPAQVWQANYAFRGVVVEAGTHQIEMRFRPQSVLVGAAISAATLALLAAGSVVALTRQRYPSR